MLRMAPYLLWEPHSTCWLIPTCTGRCFLDYAWNVFDFFSHPACSLLTNMVTCLATNSVSFLRCVQVAYSLPPLLLKHLLTTHPPTLLHADHLKSAWLLFLYVYASLVSVLPYRSGRLMSLLPCLLPLFRFPLTLSVFLSSSPHVFHSPAKLPMLRTYLSVTYRVRAMMAFVQLRCPDLIVSRNVSVDTNKGHFLLRLNRPQQSDWCHI